MVLVAMGVGRNGAKAAAGGRAASDRALRPLPLYQALTVRELRREAKPPWQGTQLADPAEG